MKSRRFHPLSPHLSHPYLRSLHSPHSPRPPHQRSNACPTPPPPPTSAQAVQAIAALSVKDSEQQRNLTKLKRLGPAGTNGAYSNKVYNDVFKVAAESIALQAPTFIRIPFSTPWVVMMQAVMLPHVLFASIYAHDKATWSDSICPNTDALECFRL